MGTMVTLAGLDVYRAEPTIPPKGAVIVIHEIWGLVDHIKGIADRWAAEGYLAFAPDILSEVGLTPEKGRMLEAAYAEPDEAKRTAMQPQLREAMAPARSPEYGAWALERMRALVDEIEAVPGIDGRIAVTGFCFGGTSSFALAAGDDRIRAAVPYYGTAPAAERIPSIACPILAIYGELDPPIMDRLPEVREEMRAAGVDFEDVVYPGALHAFFNDTNARTYNAEYAADSWGRATRFIAEHIG